jgi:hypothetical protein
MFQARTHGKKNKENHTMKSRRIAPEDHTHTTRIKEYKAE